MTILLYVLYVRWHPHRSIFIQKYSHSFADFLRLPDAVYNDVILAIGLNTTSSTGVWKKLLYKSFSKVMRVLFFYLF